MDAPASHTYDKSALRRLARCIKMLREVSPELLTIQAAHTFLIVATEPQIPTPRLISKAGLTQSSCSRHIGLLSDKHHRGNPGLGLVESLPDPHESRRHIIELTDQGRELAAKLADVLGTTLPYSQEVLRQVRELREKSMEITSEAEAATELALGLEELIEDESMDVATRSLEGGAVASTP
ncbi:MULTISPECIES: MarR family winged helix-turn-helix transcriptional regulator [unclassified Halomonas]|uniref:MarR family winged helix-turn-helix transcriptional regulator n=1 Tax=unclassified Halomonas TaxID=2609666 RepID=UPI00288485C2|nr:MULTISPECIES: MarR family winged helix-turn-helix transcriptional regulator [unclassified Halomonas]MDT0500322.1 MarR family winged helix-turn-helix transcriptional regulator [Halomonas sp. PAR7]MDT0511181.1 MarR family winged helix-turn-helix transcriptional regulator [Halomonas sp. LES1]MDT0590530.1 MarR family winged helix-turn-helix transcriptional regulator [Halomonas sp. PAR8]